MKSSKPSSSSPELRDIIVLIAMIGAVFLLINLSEFVYHFTNNRYAKIHANSWLAFSRWTINLVLVIGGIILLRNFWVRSFALGVLLTPMLLQYLHFQYFGGLIQPIEFTQVLGNGGEISIAFLSEIQTMAVPFLIVVFLMISTFVVVNIDSFTAGRIKPFRKSLYGIMSLVLIAFLSLLHTYVSFNNSEYEATGKITQEYSNELLPIPQAHSLENVERSLTYFLVVILPKKIMKSHKKNPVLPPPELKKKNPEINVILILGESLSANRVSLLGYQGNNTTPLLAQREKLFASTIYSGGTLTKTSLPTILNRLNYPGSTPQITNQQNCLFLLAKENGLVTHFYSAQDESELLHIKNSLCPKHIQKYASRDTSKAADKHPYDSLLLEMLKPVDFEKNNFVVLHQRGSHEPYQNNYGADYNVFESTYDNSILYTDFILNEIIKYVESKTDKETFIVYTSDHGDMIRENEQGRRGHGWFSPAVYRVPLLVYGINTKHEYNSLKNIQSHFGVSNLVANILGYTTPSQMPTEVYVNGSDLEAMGGFLHIKLNADGTELSNEETKF